MKTHEQRYARQIQFAGIGSDGQQRIGRATATVLGLGALGSVSASYLARAGVGHLRLIDRDVVELSNLQRQILYTEGDARLGLPKAVAARQHLQEANSGIQIDGLVADLTPANIDGLLAGTDVLLDGTDNFETRYLINEWSAREGIPWVYGGAVGAYGLTIPILPGATPCLACLFESPPPPGTGYTCDTAGVLGPITGLIGSMQAGEALKILAGRRAAVSRSLTGIDLWTGQMQRIEMEKRRDRRCAVCEARQFPHLEARAGSSAVRLCGRNAVQVTALDRHAVDLESLASRLQPARPVVRNSYLVRFQAEGCELTVFADGRSMVSGTEDAARARSLVSRYVGA